MAVNKSIPPLCNKRLGHDLIGQNFTRLSVLEKAIKKSGSGARQWLCRCDCGGVRITSSSNLLSGLVKSCGCLYRNRAIHGKYGTRVYRIWRKMIERCTRKKNDNYSRYGGRGITVCDEWRKSFAAFYAHMGEPTTNKHSIDRIDNDRGYEPGNCRWSSATEQAGNKRGRP